MRFRKPDRYLLVLAGLFVLAILLKGDLPGEEVLPDLYRATVHRPFVVHIAGAANAEEMKRVDLESRLEVALREIDQLKDQLANRKELEEYFSKLEWEAAPFAVSGWVMTVDNDTFRRHFEVDIGSTSKVAEGWPVVVGRALLGIVIRTKARTATVRRIDDPSFKIEVEIETGDGVERGLARGDGDRGLDVRFVRKTASLSVGDRVFTSRYHKHIPPGLLVGRVAEVNDIDQDGHQEVTVTPTAALGRWARIEILKRRQR